AAAAISRPRLRAEILIVLGLTLGKSAVYAIMRLIERYYDERPIGQQSTTLNPSLSQINWFDLIYQVLAIVFALVPVALAIYLLGVGGASAMRRLGLTRTDAEGNRLPWWRDLALGAGLAALIGLPGLGVY